MAVVALLLCLLSARVEALLNAAFHLADFCFLLRAALPFGLLSVARGISGSRSVALRRNGEMASRTLCLANSAGQSSLRSSILAVGSFGCINYLQSALPEFQVAIMNEMHVRLIFATVIRSTEIEGVYIRHGFVP
jgi:hypothetical protein